MDERVNFRYAGNVFKLEAYDVTREEIIWFSQKYDPFPFHVDDQLAQQTVFAGIISSGWLTALVWLRLMHKTFLYHETILGSPSHEKMLCPTPVRPNDRLNRRIGCK
jgi:acyl dehydratase